MHNTTLNKPHQNLKLTPKLSLTIVLASILLTLSAILLFHSKTSAATLNVVAGNDAIDDNNQCQLSEAIQNINDQAQTNDDCLAGDDNNDTISLPTGTITLTADTPNVTKAITIDGQGMDTSIINGNNGQYQLRNIDLATTGTVNISDVKITAFNEFGIEIGNLDVATNVNITNVEVDGSNSTKGAYSLIGIFLGVDGTVNLNGVYVNNLSANGVNAVTGINAFAEWQSTAEISINNTTISGLSSNDSAIAGINFATGLTSGTLTPGIINANINNSTISGLLSNSSAAHGINELGVVNSGTTDIAVNLNNNTFHNISGGGGGAALAMASVTLGASDVSNTTFYATNNIITNSGDSCSLVGDIALLIGSPDPSAGTINQTITSSGGNITDDASCNNYFTDPTDQTEINPADFHLGTLGNHGGSIPTIPLEEGSIAIDGGVTVPSLTTDARGVARPQCSVYDSGAYEYNGNECPEPESNSNTLSTPLSNNTTSYLVLPDDVTNPSFTTTPANTIPSDTAYSFPTSLVSFQFDTTPGSTKAITLYFDLPGNPSDYTARKYDTNNHSFSTITSATITRETYNNKSLLKLTYNITDGDNLDQDHTVNGTIIDPVGLATQTTASPNTGVAKYWLLGLRG